MKAVVLAFCLVGCAHANDLAQAIIPAFRAEAAAVQALADVDQEKQATAKSKDEVEAWRKKYDEIMASFQMFHAALSAVGAILLTGKP
jgi:hypothetical protein